LFVATCFTRSRSSECWLVDSGCTNHMTHDIELFKELDRLQISKIRIRNGKLIVVERKGIVAIESCTSTKIISDVLCVLEIDKSLLSVGQLLDT
jgi:hypothetical protein